MKFEIEGETLERLVFLFLVVIYLVLILLTEGFSAHPGPLIDLGICFVLIWFGDDLGAYTGYARGWKVTPTPGFMIRIAGWIFLIFLEVSAFVRLFHRT